MIIYTTTMDKLPESCIDCAMLDSCGLPTMARRPDMVKKAYLSKRHSACPLREMEDENTKGGTNDERA